MEGSIIIDLSRVENLLELGYKKEWTANLHEMYVMLKSRVTITNRRK